MARGSTGDCVGPLHEALCCDWPTVKAVVCIDFFMRIMLTIVFSSQTLDLPFLGVAVVRVMCRSDSKHGPQNQGRVHGHCSCPLDGVINRAKNLTFT
ncbi:UNVERIFIED_CONTAM: hypothetical protein Sradi_5728400 [Sesamum radiatum]|uniref:Uncharacterized protein n=1 Tax=Sesamum radiatum TaxID=300843 RepID=A0AAW2L203_SESRA